MTNKTIFDSFSPALLYLAAQAASEIPRELDLDGLQLLTPAQIEAITGLPVTIISKKNSLGLTWAEIRREHTGDLCESLLGRPRYSCGGPRDWLNRNGRGDKHRRLPD
jgi:hypothetical protein